jgi:hypothetical protein
MDDQLVGGSVLLTLKVGDASTEAFGQRLGSED